MRRLRANKAPASAALSVSNSICSQCLKDGARLRSSLPDGEGNHDILLDLSAEAQDLRRNGDAHYA